MKKISFVISVSLFLFGCSKDVVIDEDGPYETVLSRIKNFNYHINQDNYQQLESDGVKYSLWFIFNEAKDTCGTLLRGGDVCNFSLVFKNDVHEYNVAMKNSKYEIIEEQISYKCLQEKQGNKLKSIKSGEYGVCQYISEVGFSIGCWALPDNPFGYYHVIITKIGDPITAYHYQWCADWQGNAVSCPLNETTYNAVECRPPNL